MKKINYNLWFTFFRLYFLVNSMVITICVYYIISFNLNFFLPDWYLLSVSLPGIIFKFYFKNKKRRYSEGLEIENYLKKDNSNESAKGVYLIAFEHSQILWFPLNLLCFLFPTIIFPESSTIMRFDPINLLFVKFEKGFKIIPCRIKEPINQTFFEFKKNNQKLKLKAIKLWI
jgi:hypothetical protein